MASSVSSSRCTNFSSQASQVSATLRGVVDDVVTRLAVRAHAPAGDPAQHLLGADVEVHDHVQAFGGEHLLQRLGLSDIARKAVKDEPPGPTRTQSGLLGQVLPQDPNDHRHPAPGRPGPCTPEPYDPARSPRGLRCGRPRQSICGAPGRDGPDGRPECLYPTLAGRGARFTGTSPCTAGPAATPAHLGVAEVVIGRH